MHYRTELECINKSQLVHASLDLFLSVVWGCDCLCSPVGAALGQGTDTNPNPQKGVSVQPRPTPL